MSLYNLLFGMNTQTDLLLAVIGLRRCDIERFRDVFVEDDGKTIVVHTRTGGGNRSDYPNLTMRKRPEWRGSQNDDFDSTYCNDTFAVPDTWIEDVAHLNDPLAHGLRKEFAAHLAATLRREPTEADRAAAAYEAERSALSRVQHVKANGHTFVPYDDVAMKSALEIAEQNDGELRTCWGILPLTLIVHRDRQPYPKAPKDELRLQIERVRIDYKWTIDETYWQHCQERWAEEFPATMAKIAESVEAHREKTGT